MYKKYHQAAGPREIHKIVDEAMNDFGLIGDQPLAPELAQRFQHEVSKRMASWILGLQHETPLTPDQLNELLYAKQK